MESKHGTKSDFRAKVADTLPVIQPGEREIFTIKRHPIGRAWVYSLCLFVTLLATGLALVLAPGALDNGSGEQDFTVGIVVFLITGVIAMVFAVLMTKINQGNSWTLTNDSLTQVEQIGLFKRHSSQLALDDVEDVSSEQNGLLPEMFNYGLLRVETAGEQGKFVFNLCPNPNYYAAQILAAREAFEQHPRKENETVRSSSPEPEIVSYEVPGGPDGSV